MIMALLWLLLVRLFYANLKPWDVYLLQAEQIDHLENGLVTPWGRGERWFPMFSYWWLDVHHSIPVLENLLSQCSQILLLSCFSIVHTLLWKVIFLITETYLDSQTKCRLLVYPSLKLLSLSGIVTWAMWMKVMVCECAWEIEACMHPVHLCTAMSQKSRITVLNYVSKVKNSCEKSQETPFSSVLLCFFTRKKISKLSFFLIKALQEK